ncbi:mitogen-activated protein kinase kinase kinase kinase 2-like isoform X3 [Oreochromis aureus]|uniref:mitogen-activated protein kinase kinase kinase kinase 2-like isoform X3 n=1 Tax=Oreochromis aureus TaxID=47969 RepID=UPI00195382A9|nr:mitogen-activated protein kinase kinase kinase kinase 2-like isoform X3 [Oreochromis aureus]
MGNIKVGLTPANQSKDGNRPENLNDTITLELCPAASAETSTTSTTMYNHYSSSWVSHLQIPWERFPLRLSHAITRGDRAQPEDRRSMVRIVVEAMQVHCRNPKRASCEEVAKIIVNRYPQTFADFTEKGERLGCGHYSLLRSIKSRVEYVIRDNTTHRLHQTKRTRNEEDCSPNSSATPPKKVRCLIDSYGCINWQPVELPEGETPASLEEKKHILLTIFNSEGPEPLGQALITKGRSIINYFSSQKLKWNLGIRTLIQQIESEGVLTNNKVGTAAIFLMMKYYKEDEDSLFVLADLSFFHTALCLMLLLAVLFLFCFLLHKMSWSFFWQETSTRMSLEAESNLPIAPRLIMLVDQVKFGPPLRKVTEPYPDLACYDDWSLSGDEGTSPSLLECVEQALELRSLTIKRVPCADVSGGRKSGVFSPSTASLPAFSSLTPNTEDKDLTPRPTCTLGPDSAVTADSTTALARCSATQDITKGCSETCRPAEGAVTAELVTTASSPKRETPLKPEWSTLRRKTKDDSADCHGLPPTPQVHMGACFSKVFNGCPLKINCAVTWIFPKTRDQHLILGAEEGIYTLNLNELHEDTLKKLLPQRCIWLYVMNNVLMSVSGKSSQLYSHSLPALFEQKGHLHKKHSSLSLSTNRLTERMSLRKFAISVKIPDTKGCRRCSVARNPYTDSTFLCGAVPSGLVLLLWYEPLQKFMHLKQLAIRLPDSLPIFELLVLATDEFPQLCVGVRDCSNDKPPTGQQLRLPCFHASGDSGALRAVQVTQLDRDTVLITLERTVKIVNLQGLPSRQLAAEIVFDFPIETLVCLQDSVLAFWKHGLKGRSFHSDEVTQEITDESRVFRVLGTNRDIILQSTPTDDPSALSSLYILTGHESSY